jgi:GT2 family glycosyltransferase
MEEVRLSGVPRSTQIVADEAWAWAADTESPVEIDVSGVTVTAVLVSHNAAAWLPAALASLGELTHRPDRFVAVDTGSDDDSLQFLQRAGLFDLGVAGAVRDGFGQAVKKALAALDEQQGPQARTEWLWLLHDDITAEPDSLRRLLECTVQHPDADVIGPKLLQPATGNGPRRISEFGVSISDTARRELGLEPGEIDQLQHRGAEVLGVSTCGMLVRRTVFDELGGLASEIPVFRDGVEFGWRATAAGHRVRTCPDAVITHQQVGRSGLRRSRLVGRNPLLIDRLLGMRVVAAHRGRLAGLRLVLGGLLRALGFLLAKAPDRSRAELRAVGAFLDPAPVDSLRTRVNRPVDTDAAARVRALRPPWWSSFHNGAETAIKSAGERWQAAFGADTDTSLDELTGDDFAAANDRPHRSTWTNPLVILFGVTVLGTLGATRGLIRPGVLTADLLLPARSGLTEAYQAYLTPIVGAPGMVPPPWLGWTALGSTVTFGQPDWFVGLLLLGGPVLALLTSTLLLRRVVRDRRIQLFAAVLYAVAPVLLGVVNRGLLGVAVLWVLLPLLALTVRDLAVRDLTVGRTGGPEAWRAVWGTALLLSVVLAFLPALGALVLVAAVVGGIVLAVRRDRPRLLRLAVAVAVPVVVLAPWLPSIVRNWSRLLAGPDAGLGDLAVNPVWQLLLGRTPGPGLPPLWVGALVFGTIWLLGLFGAMIQPRSIGVCGAWVTALGAFTLAVVLSRQLATVLPQGTRVRPDVTGLLLVGSAALVLAAAIGFGRVPAALTSRSFGPIHLGTGLVGLAAIAALLVGAVWWVAAGAAGPVQRTELEELPPYLRNAMLSDARTRILAIEFDGEAPRWSLIAGDQLRLGDADRGLAFGGSGSMEQRTDNMVARLVGGAGDDRVADDLTSIAVAHVWVRGATPEQRSRINNTPGLGAASGDDTTTVWSVPATTGRMVITGGAAPVLMPSTAGNRGAIELPATQRPRQLIIHEPTDPRWRITFAGNQLPTRTAADRTIVDLPPQAGRLEVAMNTPVHSWLVLGQMLAVLVLVILAAPVWRTPAPLGKENR